MWICLFHVYFVRGFSFYLCTLMCALKTPTVLVLSVSYSHYPFSFQK
uniref:Uncharacterized protein n=1 Tax=Arundo donax TaxID=35708 RepID=A0A0A8Z781_ARUDO